MQINATNQIEFSAKINPSYYHSDDLKRIKEASLSGKMTEQEINSTMEELKRLFTDSVEIRLYNRKINKVFSLGNSWLQKVKIIKDGVILAEENVIGYTIKHYADVAKKLAKSLKAI